MSTDGSSRHSVGPAAAWKLIGSRDFGPYFVGNALSSSGTWFQNLAGSILVYRLTHSPFLLGILNAAQFGPVLLLAPWTLERGGELVAVTSSQNGHLNGSQAYAEAELLSRPATIKDLLAGTKAAVLFGVHNALGARSRRRRAPTAGAGARSGSHAGSAS
jgi:hypothetical protein